MSGAKNLSTAVLYGDAEQPGWNVARYLAARLAQMGVGHLFAVPGDYAGHFLTTIDNEGGRIGIERIGTCNEMEAGYSADAYARLRGAGAACVTFGVGTFSMLNALAGSFVEQLPVVVIVGSPASAARVTERREGVLFHHSTGTLSADEESVRHVTVWREVVRDPLRAPEQIDRALRECLTWRRPVYIEVLANVWWLECEKPRGRLEPGPLPLLAESLDRAVDATLQQLWSANRPVVWAGLEVQRFGLQGLLMEIVRETGAPFATDLLAKGVVPENTPGFVGCFDGASAQPKTRRLMQKADWVLGLGNLVTDDFLDFAANSYGRISLAWNNSVRVGSAVWDCVPLRAFMERLLERLKEKKYGAPEGALRSLAAVGEPERRLLLGGAVKGASRSAKSPGVTYDRFFERMTRWVDDSMILMADTTIALYSAAELPVNVADGFIAQAAWNSIGYTTGACLGVGFADPERRAVVFSGDGGFQMIAQALSDVVRAGQGAIVFIFDNRLYGIEQAFVNAKYFAPTDPDPPEAFDLLHGWDYSRLTDVFRGGWSATVETMAELDAALETAKGNTRTLSLITLRIPMNDITKQMLQQATG